MIKFRRRLDYLEAEQLKTDNADRFQKELEMQASLHLPLPDECSDDERADFLERLIAAIEKGRGLDHESASAFLEEFVRQVDCLHQKYSENA